MLCASNEEHEVVDEEAETDKTNEVHSDLGRAATELSVMFMMLILVMVVLAHNCRLFELIIINSLNPTKVKSNRS